MVKSNKVADKNLEIETIPAENQTKSTKNVTANNLTKKKIALLAITMGMGEPVFLMVISSLFTIFICSLCGMGLVTVPTAFILSK